MKIGAKIRDTLDEAIRLRDKVVLILSESSVSSDWVEDEITKAFEEERQRSAVVLFPVRLDDAVFATTEAWALKLRDNRHVGDFRGWKDHDAYQRSLERLLRDLRIEAAATPLPVQGESAYYSGVSDTTPHRTTDPTDDGPERAQQTLAEAQRSPSVESRSPEESEASQILERVSRGLAPLEDRVNRLMHHYDL